MRNERRGRLAFLLGMAWLAAACVPFQPSPTLAPAATASDWIAARVEQPVAIEGQPTDAPGFCSPCHPAIGTYIDSLVAFSGGYLALGYDQPPSHAAAWISVDAADWRRMATLPAPEESGISAAVGPASAGDGIVAVGTSGGVAAVWRSGDGLAWTQDSLPAPAEVRATERLTAVARTSDGYAAGGYVESATAGRTATFWRSSDGVAWVRATAGLPSGPSEITGIAASPAGGAVVAVGISGDERRGTAAAWRSSDGGARWQAIASPSLAGGRMLAVAADSNGFAAVGETPDQSGAAAWTSIDGSSWSAAPAQPALANGGLQLVITALAPDGSGFVAVGWKTDAGNGSAVVWQSRDGLAWARLPQEASFSGAGMAAVLAAPRLLAAGTMGWPDTHSAQVWIAPQATDR